MKALHVENRMVLDLDQYSQLLSLGILVLGTGLAFVARIAVRRLFARDAGTPAGTGATRALALLAFWSVLAATAALALAVLGIGQTTQFLDTVLAFMPRAFAALLLLVGGHLLGIALSALLRRRLTSVPVPPRVAYWLASGPAIIAAAEQLGIEVSFVANLALVAFTVAVGAMGLAFALGARGYVANLVARRELDGYREGDMLRVNGVEGTVAELRRTGIVLATADDWLPSQPCALPKVSSPA